ncbi:hypothetical protein ACFVHB_21645 [Kitasatospora sp. NPDC127111]|uniref:hypothetical protein n=1 Tax=Kitasatospora sp. NPDC127111 TaxID=3345363 RepID=UPI0036304469
MGIYLVGVDTDDWHEEEALGPVADALRTELARRDLPPYTCPDPAEHRPRSGRRFEVKLNRPMDGFGRLCRERADGTEEALLGWDVLLPVDLEGPLVLPVPSAYNDPTTIGSALHALAAARGLAELLQLPAGIPRHCDRLDLNAWFAGPAAAEAAAVAPGPWSEDLDTAFYAAVHLRAAEHALRRGCPVSYT